MLVILFLADFVHLILSTHVHLARKVMFTFGSYWAQPRYANLLCLVFMKKHTHMRSGC